MRAIVPPSIGLTKPVILAVTCIRAYFQCCMQYVFMLIVGVVSVIRFSDTAFISFHCSKSFFFFFNLSTQHQFLTTFLIYCLCLCKYIHVCISKLPKKFFHRLFNRIFSSSVYFDFFYVVIPPPPSITTSAPFSVSGPSVILEDLEAIQ